MVALSETVEADYLEIIALTSRAFRGAGPDASWNVEDVIDGDALTGQTEPFPYGDSRYGAPNRDDLVFLVLERAI